VLGVFAFGLAKFAQLQFTFHGFGFMTAVIDAFACRALQFYERLLFCGHILN
jgi:hypothetical protein